MASNPRARCVHVRMHAQHFQWCKYYFSRHLHNDSGKFCTLGHAHHLRKTFDTRVATHGSREDRFDTGLCSKRRGESNVICQVGERPQAVEEQARSHLQRPKKMLPLHGYTLASEFASWAALSSSSQLS